MVSRRRDEVNTENRGAHIDERQESITRKKGNGKEERLGRASVGLPSLVSHLLDERRGGDWLTGPCVNRRWCKRHEQVGALRSVSTRSQMQPDHT